MNHGSLAFLLVLASMRRLRDSANILRPDRTFGRARGTDVSVSGRVWRNERDERGPGASGPNWNSEPITAGQDLSV